MTHYELRPRNGKPLYTFDRLDRAKEFRMQHFTRVKTMLRLVEVTRVEREVVE